MASPQDEERSVQLAEELNSWRKAGRMTDLILACSEMEMPAHKVILCARSQYFNAMISSGLKESTTGTIQLSTVGAEEMEVILHFIYTGKFQDIDEGLLLKKVLAASHLMQINDLQKWCFDKLVRTQLNQYDNFIEISHLAQLFDHSDAKKQIAISLARHLTRNAMQKEFLQLTEGQIKEVVQCLDLNQGIPSMDVVIRALFQWAEAEEVYEKRDDSLLRIIKESQLDFGLISDFLLKELLGREELIAKHAGLYFKLASEASSRMPSASRNMKVNEPKYIVFGENSDEQHVFRIYDVIRDQWSTPTVLPFKLNTCMSMAWFGEHVYIFHIDDIFQYCPAANTATLCLEMDEPVTRVSIAVVKESIYLVESLPDPDDQNIVLCYEPLTNSCKMIASTLISYHHPETITFEGYLYVLGADKNENIVERYDPETDTWTIITVIPAVSESCSVTICCRQLVFVPMPLKSKYYTYDFSSDTWETKQFRGGTKDFQSLSSAIVNGVNLLLTFDGKNVLHLYNVDCGQWIRKTNPQLSLTSCYHALLV